MQGVLKAKSGGNQFLLLISITLASFFILGLVGTLAISAITGIGINEMSDISKLNFTKPETINLIRGMQVVQFISLFVVPTFICAKLFSTNTRKYLGFKAPSNTGYFLVGIGVMLLSIPLINLLGELNKNVHFPSVIEKWMKSSEEEAAKTIKALLSKQTFKDLILNIIFIAGLAAVGEELLFRGIVQRLLTKMFKSPWAGIIIAAFLFSTLHMQFYGFLPRFVLGILLGLIYWYSGSLWPAILAHFVYDAFFITVIYFRPEMVNDVPSVKLSALAIGAVISLALVTYLVSWMKKKSSTTYSDVYSEDNTPVKDHPF